MNRYIKKSIIFFLFFISAKNIFAQCQLCYQNFGITHLVACNEKLSWKTDAETLSMDYWAIDRSTNNSTWVQIGTVPGQPGNSVPHTLTFTDTNPYSTGTAAGSTAFYRVRAVKSTDGVSNFSPIIPQTLQSPQCSGLPAQNFCSGTPVLSAPNTLLLCNGSANVSITTTSITPQTIQWSSSNSGVLSVAASSGVFTGATITPVAVGAATITAYLPYCNKTVTKTMAVCACPAVTVPTSLAYAYVASPGNVVTWSPVANATGYNVEITDNTSGGSPSIVTASTNGVNATSLFLVSGHTYQVRVNAYNACSSSAYTSLITFTFIPCSLAANQTTFVASNCCGTGVYCSCINMSWAAVAGATQYEVEYKVFNNSGSIYGSGTLTTTSTSVLGNFSYSPGLYTHFKVRVKCASGLWGIYSAFSNTFAL